SLSHVAALLGLWARRSREPPLSGRVLLPGLRPRRQRRHQRGEEHPGGRACRHRAWREARSLGARRNANQPAGGSMNTPPKGIPVLQGREEVKTFGLIHGAWHGAWCWEPLVAELERRGHRAMAVDLPCDDPAATTMDNAKLVADALGDADDVVVVGHSLGG